MRNIVTIAIKDLRLLWRDKFGMFWVIVFPLMMATFFGSLMSGMNQQSPVKIAVVDEDDSEISRAFLKQLGESTAVAIVKPPRVDQQAANGEAAPVEEKVDVDLTRGQVQAGDVAAYVLVKKGFGENGFMPVASAVEIGIDPSRRVEAGLLQGVIMEAVFAPMKDLFSKPERMKEQIAKVRESLEKADDLRADQRLMFKALFAAVDQISDTMANEAICARIAVCGGEARNRRGDGAARGQTDERLRDFVSAIDHLGHFWLRIGVCDVAGAGADAGNVPAAARGAGRQSGDPGRQRAGVLRIVLPGFDLPVGVRSAGVRNTRLGSDQAECGDRRIVAVLCRLHDVCQRIGAYRARGGRQRVGLDHADGNARREHGAAVGHAALDADGWERKSGEVDDPGVRGRNLARTAVD